MIQQIEEAGDVMEQEITTTTSTTAFSRLVRLPTLAKGKVLPPFSSCQMAIYRYLCMYSGIHYNAITGKRQNVSRIPAHDRPVWFIVLDVMGEEASGPYSANQLCAQWKDGLIDGETLVWTSDNPECDYWAPIDHTIHRSLKAILLRPYLPPVSNISSSIIKGKKESLLQSLVNAAMSHHKPKPLALLKMDVSCSACGCLASISCSGCDDKDSSKVSFC